MFSSLCFNARLIMEQKMENSQLTTSSAPFPPGVAVVFPFDPTTQSVIMRAMSWDLTPVVERYSRESGLPMSVCREHEIELKRYLILCALRRRPVFGMRGPVDDLWHTFIIFTNEYHRFCDGIAGQYIHHVPDLPGQSSIATILGYDATWTEYRATFGEDPPSHIWPNPDAIRADSASNGCHDSGSCAGPGCADASGCSAYA